MGLEIADVNHSIWETGCGVQRGNGSSAGLCLLASCSAVCIQALQDQWNVGAWVGVLGQALEQRFNAWKITMSGRDGEEG